MFTKLTTMARPPVSIGSRSEATIQMADMNAYVPRASFIETLSNTFIRKK